MHERKSRRKEKEKVFRQESAEPPKSSSRAQPVTPIRVLAIARSSYSLICICFSELMYCIHIFILCNSLDISFG